jgi:hypothetical protein
MGLFIIIIVGVPGRTNSNRNCNISAVLSYYVYTTMFLGSCTRTEGKAGGVAIQTCNPARKHLQKCH